MSGKRRRGICAYCGKEKKLTRDHVFPKALFIKSDPETFTVPACNDCNQRKSRGDSDLEVFANLDIYGSTHPDNLDHIERIVNRGQATVDWLDKTINAAREIPIQTEAGIVVGNSLEITGYNFDRILESLNMSVRGLYYASRSEVLPTEVPTHVFRMPWNLSLQTLGLLAPHRRGEPTMKGNNVVFWGELNIELGDPYDTMWVMCIYDAIVFLGVTGKKWTHHFPEIEEKLEKQSSTQPERDYTVIRPAPDGNYRLSSQS